MVDTARDDAVLDHIGRYRISIRDVIAREFFGGGNCGNVLQRLIRTKRIEVRKFGGIPHSYYQLSLPEARRRGIPQNRATRLGPVALTTHLAVLLFCHEPGAKRRRLHATELNHAIGISPPGWSHVAEAGKDPCIRRMRLVSPQLRPADAVKRIRVEVVNGLRDPSLCGWISSGRYVFTFMTESDLKRDRLLECVKRNNVATLARIDAVRVVTPQTLRQALTDDQ